jgi:hypothetical protein
MLCVLGGMYSFFSPKRLTAVDALQSNGAQLAVMGAATTSILAYSPGLPFYCLFAVMAVDLFLSCSLFMNEHAGSIRSESD